LRKNPHMAVTLPRTYPTFPPVPARSGAHVARRVMAAQLLLRGSAAGRAATQGAYCMKRLCWMAGVSLLLAACGNQDSPVTSAAAASSYQPHANLAQMMRAIPFPSSNIIFDTQSEDP